MTRQQPKPFKKVLIAIPAVKIAASYTYPNHKYMNKVSFYIPGGVVFLDLVNNTDVDLVIGKLILHKKYYKMRDIDFIRPNNRTMVDFIFHENRFLYKYLRGTSLYPIGNPTNGELWIHYYIKE